MEILSRLNQVKNDLGWAGSNDQATLLLAIIYCSFHIRNFRSKDPSQKR